MTIQRMDHVGIVVDDLAAATEFFVELGLVLQGEGPVEGRWVDRVVGLEGVRADIAMMQNSGRQRTTRGDEVPLAVKPGRQPATRRRTRRVSATSHSPSRISTPSLPACEPAALDSSASWSATRTPTGFATSAARRESSLS
jgi:catechol 2,3-dioxygenase-like lactoylglutathione lyase family enzyme